MSLHVVQSKDFDIFTAHTVDGQVALVQDQLISGSVVPASASNPLTATATAEADLYVPVSSEGATIRNQVRLPLMHRRPVGYQRDFLETYQPGTTFYLPEPLRHQLHEMGRTSAHERPAGTYAREHPGPVAGRAIVGVVQARGQYLQPARHSEPDRVRPGGQGQRSAS